MLRNKRIKAILGSTILLVMGFFSSTQALAVDPDMQALVIDNGSCMSGESYVDSGNCVPVSDAVQVPEPSTLALMVIGLAAIAVVGYRRKKNYKGNTPQ